MATNGITTLGNRTFLFGGASGIDTSKLVEAAYNQRKVEADKIDVRVQSNNAKYEAYNSLRTLSDNVISSLSNIKQNFSVLESGNTLFDQRVGALSADTSVNPQGLFDVTLDPGTELGTHEIIAQQKAQVHRVSSFGQSNITNALGMTGNFTIGLVGNTATSVSVTSGMSLTDVANAINAGSSTSGVTAILAKVSETSYELVLQGSDVAKNINIGGVSGTNVMKNLGVIDAGGAFKFVRQPAQAGVVIMDGITYTRNSNDFSDLLPGISLKLKGQDPATTVTLNVENDNSGIKEGIIKFIDAYNELRDFVKSQQIVSEAGAVDDGAVLFGDMLLSTLNTKIQGILGGSYGAGGTALSSLREVGITLDVDNRLEIDEADFDVALINNFEDVRNIFQTNASSDNSEFRMTGSTYTGPAVNFTLGITYAAGNISNVSVNGQGGLFDISGTTISGKVGTAYEGMTFAYVGTTSASINVSLTTGISDALNSVLDGYTDILTGDISDAMNQLADLNKDLEIRSTRVLERAADFRDRLIEKYANFESRLSAAQTVLAQLRALLGTNKNDNNN